MPTTDELRHAYEAAQGATATARTRFHEMFGLAAELGDGGPIDASDEWRNRRAELERCEAIERNAHDAWGDAGTADGSAQEV